ncbi:hypothetical protein E2C01_048847 [Portunus trituberculatus]|uniref:Uncharacterized protein n=1 Tax=Portunus trituberculatus TaxID=210409 RepID=A0A5B7GCM6_PORTR|nr:hypothetical protein [Portunus trituberculatus]
MKQAEMDWTRLHFTRLEWSSDRSPKLKENVVCVRDGTDVFGKRVAGVCNNSPHARQRATDTAARESLTSLAQPYYPNIYCNS